MSDEELDAEVENISVYARVSPENKIRIVKAWQKKGQVVSMTGDGVNDAPALKAADIGCAMGITGTDVAKGAADMTLTDDNFATIVDAVKEGRGIYSNIKKVVGFLLGTNISEVIVVFLAMCIWQISPFISIQLLWINLIGDSLPAVALGMEKLEPDVMDHKPRSKKESIFAHGYGLQIVLQGCMFAALALASYCIARYGFHLSPGQCSAATFLVLALSQSLHAYNMRSGHSLFKIGPFCSRSRSSRSCCLPRASWACSVSAISICLGKCTSSASRLRSFPSWSWRSPRRSTLYGIINKAFTQIFLQRQKSLP